MKRNEQFRINKMGDNYILICKDKSVFQGMIRLSSSAEDLWELLKNDISYEKIIDYAINKYDENSTVIKNDVDCFLESLKKVNAVYE